MFKITRIYSDDDGNSHFDDVHIPLKDAGMVGKLSDPLDAKSVIFREVVSSYDWDFHPAPQRQFIVLLEGEIEIETSLGDTRRFGAGEILLAEDTEGKGHRTKNVVAQNRRSLFITL